MVWSGLFPAEGGDYAPLRDALDKLKLSDAALVYEPESSLALGFGFRCGFLGLLHMEIVKERLEREFGLELIATAPNVEFHVDPRRRGDRGPQPVRDAGCRARTTRVEEPVRAGDGHHADRRTSGPSWSCASTAAATLVDMRYLSPERAEIHYLLPLAEIIFDFFDQLKSRHARVRLARLRARGGTSQSDLVRVDILLQGEPVDAFSAVVHKDKAYPYGKPDGRAAARADPAAAVRGGHPGHDRVARDRRRETVKAKRKDVLAKCYGGDITRKRKLLEKQKEGKARMRRVGRVDVPQEAFIAALRVDQPAGAAEGATTK